VGAGLFAAFVANVRNAEIHAASLEATLPEINVVVLSFFPIVSDRIKRPKRNADEKRRWRGGNIDASGEL